MYKCFIDSILAFIEDFFIKVLIETNVNIRNALNLSGIYRKSDLHWVDSKVNRSPFGVHSLCTRPI